MNQKTRGYTGLSFCMAILVIGGMLHVAGGGVVFLVTLGSARPALNDFAMSGVQFAVAAMCFTLTGFLRLSIHIADDLYMLRLIAVNAYSRLPKVKTHPDNDS